MQFLKVSCSLCPQYRECPQKTRMFVNYCGSDKRSVESRIREAVVECRARRGQLFTKGFLVDVQPEIYARETVLSFST